MFKKDSRPKEKTEVVLRYKNVNNSDISSIDLIHTPLSFKCFKNNCNQNNENACEQPRPMPCPVCSKMIAMSSILVHFYFDHSKVLKLRLLSSKRQHIIVKAADLTFETKCIAVLLLEEGIGSTGKPNQNPIGIRPLLLLAAKMSLESSLKNNASVKEKQCIEEELIQSSKQHLFAKDDILLFWTCKTDAHELISNIKLSRKDKKLSFSYTGEAIHIRNNQNANNIYQHAEYLIIRGEAANNLLDTDNQMHVYVRFVRQNITQIL